VRRSARTLRTLLTALALALGGVAAVGLGGCGGSDSSLSAATESGSTHSRTTQGPRGQANARAIAAALHFLDRYVTADGRVSRLDQGGDTVGEGQAYGALMAAAIGDSRRFNAIWGWTKANLRRPDGLISFLWRGGHVVDPQAATDADLDASRALLVAACRFHRPSLRREALHLGDAIMREEVGSASFDGKPVLTAGPWAITPPPVTIDPSYFAPATLLALRAASHDPRWGQLAASSREIMRRLMPTAGRLPPDWAHLEGDRVVPIHDPSHANAPGVFGFDAVRTLDRFAEDPNPAGRRIAARAWPVFERADPTKLPVEHNLRGRAIGRTLHPVALVAAAGAADAAGQTAARDGLLDQAEALDRRSPTYYGAAWVALGRIMLTTRLLDNFCS
jgi:endoglucanase